MPGTSLKSGALILVIIVILVHYYFERNLHIDIEDDDDEVVQDSGLTQQVEAVSFILYVNHFVLIQLSVISTVVQN